MKKFLFAALLLTSCAAFQGKPSKFDKLQAQVEAEFEKAKAKAECIGDTLEPYDAFLTDDNLKAALAGTLDALEVLKAMEVDPAEVIAVGEKLKDCAK